MEKNTEDFYANQKACKSCFNNKRKAYYVANRDEILRKCRVYRAKNRDKINAAKRKRYRDNPESVKQWRRRNPLKSRFAAICCGAKNKGRPIPFSFDEWKERFFDQPCAYCGSESNGGIDRVDNERGYDPDNCLPCCRLCNTIKSNLSLTKCAAHMRTMLASIARMMKEGGHAGL